VVVVVVFGDFGLDALVTEAGGVFWVGRRRCGGRGGDGRQRIPVRTSAYLLFHIIRSAPAISYFVAPADRERQSGTPTKAIPYWCCPLRIVDFFFGENTNRHKANVSLMTLERREPRNENVYDNGNPCERGLRNDFRPILDGVPRFGPPQDPNITIKKIKTC